MKKLSLLAIGMYLGIIGSFSQNVTRDSSTYKSRKLTLQEINFTSGYYHQDGNNSAVTGGIGTEKLTEFANNIELRLFAYDKKQRKQLFHVEMGVDHYTSASSDNIDPHTISSASKDDTRYYPSAGWSVENEQKGTNFGVNVSYSKEVDYTSRGIGANFTKSSADKNRQFTAGLQAYIDQWLIIYPIELRPVINNRVQRTMGTSPRNSFSGSFSLSQVVSQRLEIAVTVEPTYQQGLLATKYQRVYFTDGTVNTENLPDHRFKLPIGLRANYFMGDKFILRTLYRYYKDNWGISAHTIELELPVKITPFLSLSPFYRLYSQQAMKYFAAYGQHIPTDKYYSSDYDLSTFNSNYLGVNFRISPPVGIFHLSHWSSVELRYGHYSRSNGLKADQVSVNLGFK